MNRKDRRKKLLQPPSGWRRRRDAQQTTRRDIESGDQRMNFTLSHHVLRARAQRSGKSGRMGECGGPARKTCVQAMSLCACGRVRQLANGVEWRWEGRQMSWHSGAEAEQKAIKEGIPLHMLCTVSMWVATSTSAYQYRYIDGAHREHWAAAHSAAWPSATGSTKWGRSQLHSGFHFTRNHLQSTLDVWKKKKMIEDYTKKTKH